MSNKRDFGVRIQQHFFSHTYRGAWVYITLYIPKIFKIARKFDQKRYIYSWNRWKFAKFSKNVIYTHRYIYSLTPVIESPLRFFKDYFASFHRIWTVDGALERQGASASRAFGFSKKYLKTKKLSRKNFCNLFFITRFSKNIFKNIFAKNQKCDFRFFFRNVDFFNIFEKCWKI